MTIPLSKPHEDVFARLRRIIDQHRQPVPQAKYTDAALTDLAKITRVIIANTGPLVADRVNREIQTSLMHVATYPQVGWKRSCLAKGLLSWPLSSYLAHYTLREDGMDVVPIVHGRRRVTRKLLAEQ